jgi:S-adenosylmethionine:tRNA ribosyltransferase-isomerase
VTLDDYDFELPPGQVAQVPLPERDASRLLTLDRATGAIGHRQFRELPSLLRGGDLLVLNDTRVIPARLLGKKIPTGGRAELLLVRPSPQVLAERALAQSPDAVEWICLGQASKGLKAGARVALEGGVEAEVVEALGEGELRVRFSGAPGGEVLGGWLQQAGRLPLPPYIDRAPGPEDADRYQTVFGRHPGSVAAPTASLHFTDGVLQALAARGVERAWVTLEVGPGTFLPVREDIASHRMHAERYHLPEETVAQVAKTKARGGRVVAVGTTVVRTLEGATLPATGTLRPGHGETALFIQPGFAFRQVDALLTNFHLPRSTLLMLVSAFAGHPQVMAAYREAVARGYRFFSFGDAMWISEGA